MSCLPYGVSSINIRWHTALNVQTLRYKVNRDIYPLSEISTIIYLWKIIGNIFFFVFQTKNFTHSKLQAWSKKGKRVELGWCNISTYYPHVSITVHSTLYKCINTWLCVYMCACVMSDSSGCWDLPSGVRTGSAFWDNGFCTVISSGWMISSS